MMLVLDEKPPSSASAGGVQNPKLRVGNKERGCVRALRIRSLRGHRVIDSSLRAALQTHG